MGACGRENIKSQSDLCRSESRRVAARERRGRRKSGGAKRPTDSWPGAFELLIFQFPPHIRDNLHYGSLPESTHPPLGLLCEVIAAVITRAPPANIGVRKCRSERVAGGGSDKVTQRDGPWYFHKFALSLWWQNLLSVCIFRLAFDKWELSFISPSAFFFYFPCTHVWQRAIKKAGRV